MSRFVQLHLLISYPPSNLNRDDLGRPKTAIMGGKTRLRISSQSLKRAWRTSDIVDKTLEGHIGVRTKRLGKDIILKQLPLENLHSEVWANDLLTVYGEPDSEPGILKQLVFVSPSEELVLREFLNDIARSLNDNTPPSEIVEKISALQKKREGKSKAEDKKTITNEIVGLLRNCLLHEKITTAFDIAMFGRMLASSPAHNIEAAVQVAHAITVHEVAVEDDYFTAVDDLNKGEEDMGAAHIGQTEFAAGLYYLYVCINRDLLKENLGGDSELVKKGLAALVESTAKISPTGKQNSFASRAYASYLLAEKGDQQPRSLSVAFLKPVRGEDMLAAAISSLEEKRSTMDKVYGDCADDFKVMDAEAGKGSLEEIIKFVME
jgi:CRISPR system Cascade subunit CasC